MNIDEAVAKLNIYTDNVLWSDLDDSIKNANMKALLDSMKKYYGVSSYDELFDSDKGYLSLVNYAVNYETETGLSYFDYSLTTESKENGTTAYNSSIDYESYAVRTSLLFNVDSHYSDVCDYESDYPGIIVSADCVSDDVTIISNTDILHGGASNINTIEYTFNYKLDPESAVKFHLCQCLSSHYDIPSEIVSMFVDSYRKGSPMSEATFKNLCSYYGVTNSINVDEAYNDANMRCTQHWDENGTLVRTIGLTGDGYGLAFTDLTDSNYEFTVDANGYVEVTYKCVAYEDTDTGRLYLTDDFIKNYVTLDYGTAVFESYDDDSVINFFIDTQNESISSGLDNKFNVSGINYSGNVTGNFAKNYVSGFDGTSVLGSYLECLDGSKISYNDYCISFSNGSVTDHVSEIEKTLNGKVYNYNDFGFYMSLLIDGENSNLSSDCYKCVKTSTVNNENYYSIFLDNGQYVVLENKETYQLDEIESIVSNSDAYKANEMQNKIAEKYKDKPYSIDVKYSDTTNRYAVYINGNLYEGSEESVLNSLPDDDILISSESSYTNNIGDKFNNCCININDEATYLNLIKFLDKYSEDNFLTIELGYEKGFVDSVSSHLSNSSSCYSLNDKIGEFIGIISKYCKNLNLQVENCINILLSYDMSLKTYIDELINSFFSETNIVSNNEGKIISVLDDKSFDVDYFIDDFVSNSKKMLTIFQKQAEGCVCLSKDYVENSFNDEDLGKYDYEYNEELGCYFIHVNENFKDTLLERLNKNDNADKELIEQYNLLDSICSSGENLLQYQQYVDNYSKFIDFTDKFGSTVLSEEYANALQEVRDSDIKSDFFTSTELALMKVKYNVSFDKIMEFNFSEENYNLFDEILREGRHEQLGALPSSTDSNLYCYTDASFTTTYYDIFNEVTGKDFNERYGYACALDYYSWIVNNKDSGVFGDVCSVVSLVDVGFDSGIRYTANGLKYFFGDSNTSSESYCMTYLKSFLTETSNDDLVELYSNGKISLKEYNLRRDANETFKHLNNYNIALKTGEAVGKVTDKALRKAIVAAYPTFAPCMETIEMISAAGYKANEYYMSTDRTSFDQLKSKLYGCAYVAVNKCSEMAIDGVNDLFQNSVVNLKGFNIDNIFGETDVDAFAGAISGKSFLKHVVSVVNDTTVSGLVGFENLYGYMGYALIDRMFSTDKSCSNDLSDYVLGDFDFIYDGEDEYSGKYSDSAWLDWIIRFGVAAVSETGSNEVEKIKKERENNGK